MLCSDEVCLVSEFLDHPKDLINLLTVNIEWNSIKEEEIYKKSLVLRFSEIKKVYNKNFMKNISKPSSTLSWKQKYDLLIRIIKEEEFLNFIIFLLSNENLSFGEKWKNIIKNIKNFKNYKFLQNVHIGNRESLLDLFFKSMFFVKLDEQEAFDHFEEIYSLTGLKMLSKHGMDYPYSNLLRTNRIGLISKIKERSAKEFKSLNIKEEEKIQSLVNSSYYERPEFNMIKSILDRYQSKLFDQSCFKQYESMSLTDSTLRIFILLNYDLEVWKLFFPLIKPLKNFKLDDLCDLASKNSNDLQKLEILIDTFQLKTIDELGYGLLKQFHHHEMKLLTLLTSKTKYFEHRETNTFFTFSYLFGAYSPKCLEFLFQTGVFIARMEYLECAIKTYTMVDLVEKIKLFLKYDSNVPKFQFDSIPTTYLQPNVVKDLEDLRKILEK
jgi:hypothetical protein